MSSLIWIRNNVAACAAAMVFGVGAGHGATEIPLPPKPGLVAQLALRDRVRGEIRKRVGGEEKVRVRRERLGEIRRRLDRIALCRRIERKLERAQRIGHPVLRQDRGRRIRSTQGWQHDGEGKSCQSQ